MPLFDRIFGPKDETPKKKEYHKLTPAEIRAKAERTRANAAKITAKREAQEFDDFKREFPAEYREYLLKKHLPPDPNRKDSLSDLEETLTKVKRIQRLTGGGGGESESRSGAAGWVRDMLDTEFGAEMGRNAIRLLAPAAIGAMNKRSGNGHAPATNGVGGAEPAPQLPPSNDDGDVELDPQQVLNAVKTKPAPELAQILIQASQFNKELAEIIGIAIDVPDDEAAIAQRLVAEKPKHPKLGLVFDWFLTQEGFEKFVAVVRHVKALKRPGAAASPSTAPDAF